MNYNGNESFMLLGADTGIHVSDFWKWAYSDFVNNIQRSVLAEFIVASAINSTYLPGENMRVQWRPYDLLSPDGYRIEVKCAAYVQSWDCRHPDHVSYRIAPARMPEPDGDIRDDAPLQRNCDVYVFCLYKAISPEQSALDLDLWEFRVLKTSILDEKKPNQKTITLPSLQLLEPITCTYSDLAATIRYIMA